MNKRECEIVKDILPLYIDGLTSEETNKFVEEHLKDCDECREEYILMSENTEQKNNDKKIVNYLKKFKKSKMYSNIFISLFFLLLLIPIIIGAINYKESTSLVKKDDEMIGVAVFQTDEDIDLEIKDHPVFMGPSNLIDDVIEGKYVSTKNGPSIEFDKKPIAYYGKYISRNNLSDDDDTMLDFGNGKFYDISNKIKISDTIENYIDLKLDVDKSNKKVLGAYNIFKRPNGSFYAIMTGRVMNYTKQVTVQLGTYNYEHNKRENQYVFNIEFIPK
ncbi:zf-HC2 domain-containing protein [Helcococcus kunzii]|uniref:Putative zinc-finger domain-containing protein n=1 Tax=Helcococcus kunzii ATCC 51366 TaxID=883114 RepID=H3NMK4_9FIRM|nr:zf-HC2 domain-containing protein [Helcococcus kunzii]EHR34823.1 hypothetical protein HMPREF9709_00565 [Helcococcus kunzii ATCC 51366]MCT1796745.1 zf-HC2 domain-containing protein [Helcococcus kunzii]MCT1988867.1 zf-HC2 domain-containing protein [Helcococcus kunzii]QUY64512.1 zf-HC2 domain-containing protein [Helcococcus kunzii]QZO76925.1 zf-HC2 domain-containing protein [Helcococcus kunzii]